MDHPSFGLFRAVPSPQRLPENPSLRASTTTTTPPQFLRLSHSTLPNVLGDEPLPVSSFGDGGSSSGGEGTAGVPEIRKQRKPQQRGGGAHVARKSRLGNASGPMLLSRHHSSEWLAPHHRLSPSASCSESPPRRVASIGEADEVSSVESLVPYNTSTKQQHIPTELVRIFGQMVMAQQPPQKTAEEILAPHGLMTLMFHRTQVSPPPGISFLDTKTRLFGVDTLRDLLEKQIGIPMLYKEQFRGIRSPAHWLYMSGPDGYGKACLVLNYAREKRINYIRITNMHDYVEGMYKALLQYAQERRPCIIHLQDLESHFLQDRFANSGTELFYAWRELQNKRVIKHSVQGMGGSIPFEEIWVIITGQFKLENCNQYFASEVVGTYSAEVKILEEEEYVKVMRELSGRWLVEIGIQDDRPTFDEYSPKDEKTILAALQASRFHRELERLTKEVFEPFARAFKTLDHVTPKQMTILVDQAFKRAHYRASTNVEYLRDPQRLLPNAQDFHESASKVRFLAGALAST